MRRPMRVAVPILFILFLTCMPVQAKIFYVKADATGNNDGSSWTDACTDLQPAMDAAVANTDDPEDEIWVAAGTYYPTVEHGNSTGFPDDRYKSFQMVNGVHLMGGFDGTEIYYYQRDPKTNLTILSGDIDQDSLLNGGNVYHVFFHAEGLGLDETAELDGFTITGGMANGSDPHWNGAAMFNFFSSPRIINCTFTGNYASYLGGGIYNQFFASPSVIRCEFRDNQASFGAAIHNETSSPGIYNCLFTENTAFNQGGGITNHGSSSPIICYSTFYANQAVSGGALYNSNSTPTIINSILWADTATSGEPEMDNVDSDPFIYASDIQGCGGSGEFWNSTMGEDGGGNLDSDPQFINTHLKYNSPCIDKANSDLDAMGITLDLDGESRVSGGHADMGADEYVDTDHDGLSNWEEVNIQGTGAYDSDTDDDFLSDGDEVNTYGTFPLDSDSDDDGFEDGAEICHLSNPADGQDTPSATTLYVSLDGDNSVDSGKSWDASFLDLQYAIDLSISGDAIWVRAGTYYPTEARYQSLSFQMKNGVTIYGGFAGTETSLAQRIPYNNITILRGGSYHVFYHPSSLGLDETAVLDGCVIKGGMANGDTPHNNGGGMYNSNASPTVRNCFFTQNVGGLGGGMFNENSSPLIINCSFYKNTADYNGGGIYNANSSPAITQCSFNENEADYGGAIANNHASPTIRNSILWGDIANHQGNEIFNVLYSYSDPSISYSDIQGSGGSTYLWDSNLGEDSGGNKDSDPLFVVNDYGLKISGNSPCIDAALTSAASGIITDMDGEARSFDGDDDGTPDVDMGADEVVDTDGDGLVDRLEIAVYDTDPTKADTDDDGLSDYDEVTIYETDPNLSDSDHDDLLDGYEVNFAGTDPNKEDTDGDGYTDGQEVASGTDPLVAMGPGVPVLVYPETDATGIDLSVQLRVTYSEYGTSTTHTATRWQIAQDEAFTTLSADITSETDLLTLTVPDLVLNPETTYHWRVRFEASDGLERSWSGTGSFTTAAVADGDTNGNGLDDDQELAPGTTPAIVPGVETGWRNTVSTITFDAEDGVATQAALRLSDDGSSLVFFRQVPSADLAVACPSALDLGAFSIKIQVPAAGDSTSIRIYFSPSPLDEHSKVYKYDAENGWYDFSANAAISGDFTFITLQLTDGGAGDADGTANGVIVDPLGTSSVVPGNPSGSSGGGGGGGCFIGTTAD